MRKSYIEKIKLGRSFLFAGVFLCAVGTAVAQDDYGKIEMAPAFSYQHNSPVLGGKQGFNCAGGGSTVAYNFASMLGFAADLSGCKVFGLDNTYGIGSRVNGSEFTYVFGPRLTFRAHKFQPFFEINFGGERVGIGCRNGNAGNACGAYSSELPSTLPTGGGSITLRDGTVVAVINGKIILPNGSVLIIPRNPNATSFSKNAFAMTVGGGADIKLNKKFAIRLVQAEYLYTHFGNNCELSYCTQNNGQNSFRLKSGIVVSWGGAQ